MRSYVFPNMAKVHENASGYAQNSVFHCINLPCESKKSTMASKCSNIEV